MKQFYSKYEDYSSFLTQAFKESASKIKSSRSEYDIEKDGRVAGDLACQMARCGWIEGMELIEKYRCRITPVLTDTILRPVPANNIHGFAVDVGAYLSNLPDCFIDREFEKRNYPGRLFTLVVSCSYSWSVSTDVIIQRGAMICALVDAMEYAGHRVEVICNDTSTIYGGDYKNEVDVVLKKHDQALDLSQLAFCLAHPAMLRRIMFSINELSGWADLSRGNYGFPYEATNKGDLYIDEINTGKVSDGEAIAWLVDKLESLGVEMRKS